MEYRLSKLKDITTYIARGITPKYTEDLTGLCVINQKCIRDYKLLLENARRHDISKKQITDEKVVQKYDILINSTGVGTAGRVVQNFENQIITADSHVTIVRPDSNKINPIYLGYAVKNQQKYIEGLAEGSTGQTEISRQRIGEEILIKFPTDKQVQKMISGFLLNIDEKIKLNNQINDNLKKFIFNQYEKVSQNIETEVELDAITNISSGKRPKIKNDNLSIPIIGASGTMSYTNDSNYNKDIIIIGRVGTLGVVQRYNYSIWASDNTITIDTKYKNYIENYLKTVDYTGLNRGSTQPLLTQSDIGKQKIKFDKNIVENFESNIQVFKNKIWNNINENTKLEELRDTLLPKLMNGEIDLDNIKL